MAAEGTVRAVIFPKLPGIAKLLCCNGYSAVILTLVP